LWRSIIANVGNFDTDLGVMLGYFLILADVDHDLHVILG
jgi:hypothetical protein